MAVEQNNPQKQNQNLGGGEKGFNQNQPNINQPNRQGGAGQSGQDQSKTGTGGGQTSR